MQREQAYETLPPAQQPPQAAPLKNRAEDLAKAEAFSREDVDLEEAAEEASVPEAFQMQSILDLYREGKIKCSNENLKLSENKEGKGLMITGTPEDLNSAYFEIDKEFAFGEAGVSHTRIDALAKTKTNVTAEFYYAGSKSPFVSIPLNRQRGSKTWNWSGDTAVNVSEQGIQGTHEIWLYFKTDSTAKEVSVLLRSFEFMMDDKLPAVYVDIDENIQPIAAMNSDEQHNTECYGTMTVRTPAGFQGEYMDAPVEEASDKTYAMEYIRGRGNSTWTADKKPYKIKLEDKVNFFKMGKSKHWVLLANRFDNSLLRNKITYWMGEQLGMPFTPQSEMVDVFMNGEYLGVYYLCEQVRVEGSRVDIDDLEEDDPASEGIEATEEPTITGGYLLGLSPYEEDWDAHPEQMFGTTRSNRFEIESPEFDKHTPEAEQAQYNYIKDYVQKTEDAIYGKNFCDAEGNSWETYLDKESAIKYYWFQEVSKNGDAYASPSTYMYKERDTVGEDGTTTRGKLFFGPLWDFDYVAWGNLDYDDPPINDDFSQDTSFWFYRLMTNESFAEELKAGYADMSKVLKDSLAQLDKYADQIRVADFYEREKWGSYVEYYEDDEAKPVEVSFQGEVDLLKNWIKTRDEWISDNLDELKVPFYTITYEVDGKVVGTETVEENGYVQDIPDPGTKKGKVFAGWYVNYDGIEYRADFRWPVYENMTVYPKWVNESKAVPVKEIHFLAESTALGTMFGYFVPEPEAFPVQIVPFNATQQDLTWESSDPSVLKINEKTGLCVPLKRGTVTVTARSANGKTATCSVVVRDMDDESDYELNLKKETITVCTGDYGKIELDSSVNPATIGLTGFNYEGDVVDIGDCGVFQALKPGKAKVVIEGDPYSDGNLVCTIIVKDKEKKGAVVSKNGLKYGITKVWSKKAKAGEVTCKGFAGVTKKKVTIPASIKINGHVYKVTAVAPKAFYNCKKLKSVTFTGKTMTSIGKNAFKGIAAKAVFTVPSAGKKVYKKLLNKSAGITKSMKIRAKKITYNKI